MLSVTLQRSMIETLGCEANFGVSCLNTVGRDFAQDREVLQRMGNFQQAAQVKREEDRRIGDGKALRTVLIVENRFL